MKLISQARVYSISIAPNCSRRGKGSSGKAKTFVLRTACNRSLSPSFSLQSKLD